MFGAGYDIVLITNFLHHFDPPTNEKLLRKVRGAFAPGGLVVTARFHSERGPRQPGSRRGIQPWTMLGTTRSGDAYTCCGISEACFENAGFSSNECGL